MKRLIKKYLYRKFTKFLVKILPYSWYLKLMLDSVEVQGNTHAGKRILCLPKPLFDKDFEQLSYRLREYGWIWFEKHMFKACLDGSVPIYARGQKKYAEYLSDPNVHWDKVFAKAQLLVKALKEQHGVCCLVTANIDYYQDYALKIACQREGIPVVVLLKEYPITLKEELLFEKLYHKWNSYSDVIAVAGIKAKDPLEKAGVITSSGVVITGLPRLDRYRSIDFDLNVAPSPKITILSFREGYGDDSEEEFFGLSGTIIEVVRNSCPLLIKAKNTKDGKIISKRLNGLASSLGCENFSVLSGIPLYDAFASSSVVVGYNSLSVVEALLSRARIFIPYYIFNQANILIEDECVGCGVDFFHSEKDLLLNLKKAVDGSLPTITDAEFLARKKLFTSYWMWDEKSSSTQLFGSVLKSVIKN